MKEKAIRKCIKTLKHFNIRNYLALVLKKIFCVFQTNLNKADNILCKLLEWIRNIQLNCKVIKKSQHPPPFMRVIPFSCKIFGPPQVTQFLEGPTPSPLIRKGGSNCSTVWGIDNFMMICIIILIIH